MTIFVYRYKEGDRIQTAGLVDPARRGETGSDVDGDAHGILSMYASLAAVNPRLSDENDVMEAFGWPHPQEERSRRSKASTACPSSTSPTG
jgi:hypothetical protein